MKTLRYCVAAKSVATVLLIATGSVSAHGDETSSTDEHQKPRVEISTEWSSEETTDWGYDRKGSRSRVGMSNSVKLPGKTKALKSTTTIRQTIDIKTPKPKLLCESDIDVEYYQKGEETEVKTLFSSQNCDEYDASYQLRILYFNADGKVKRISSDEEWPLGRKEEVRKSFPMEPDSVLRRVTSHIVSCTCIDAQ